MRFFKDVRTIDDFLKKIKEYQGSILLAVGLTVSITGVTYGYFYFKKVREEKAYRAFVGAMEYFDAPIKKVEDKDSLAFMGKKEFKNYDEKWLKVDSVFKDAYESNRSSGLASLFLAYRSEALVNLKNLPEAISVLRQAISIMHNKDVRSYYEVKLALMLIDTKKTDFVREGVQALEKISLDDKTVASDMSLFRLGEYFWNSKKFKEAKNYWNQLVLKYSGDKEDASPWVDEAKEKLRLIDFDVR
jgi:predicted negative regulator of RcsB-dependent stress response